MYFLFIFHCFKIFRLLHLFGRNVLSLSLSLSLSHLAAEQCRLCLSVVGGAGGEEGRLN